MINIYRYLPEYSSDQFNHATTIDTGHRRNIFSVKFMPKSGDNKVISCAGDSEVRIFDLERSGAYLPDGTHQHLSTTSTSAKVFRSHHGAVKRIVTEGSPFYFLTCSEDGEVRQWDIRQPSTAYPKPTPHWGGDSSNDNLPPPLISYRDYNISLYTLSCSAAQPHYLALGGTHLHCFLHDRRMLGRDKLRERSGAFSPSYCSDSELDAICQATRCVRKFAPHGQPTMTRTTTAQITACKLGNYNPNELVVSWTGDNIYHFDIRRDDEDTVKTFSTNGVKSSLKTRKRKRASNGSNGILSEEGDVRGQSRSRTLSSELPDEATNPLHGSKYALRVQLRDGSSRDIPIRDGDGDGDDNAEDDLPNESVAEDGDAETIFGEMIRDLKTSMFESSTMDGVNRNWSEESPEQRDENNITILGEIVPIFQVVDENVRHWHYPTNPTSSAVHFQQKMRDDRNKVWRFVQCAGTIIRVLLRMSVHTINPELQDALQSFDIVRAAPRESSRPLDTHEQFCYDFIKAVLLWVDSGVGAVVMGFQADPDHHNHYERRQPVSKDADLEALHSQLFPYLRNLATNRPIVPCDPLDDGKRAALFATEVDAVNALEMAMQIPFADLVGGDEEKGFTKDSGFPTSQSRDKAMRTWVVSVSRALLESATTEMNYNLVETAFDGPLTNLKLLHNLRNRSWVDRPANEPWMEELGERLANGGSWEGPGEDNSDDDNDQGDDTDSDDNNHGGNADSDDDSDDDRPAFYGRDYKVRSKAAKDVPCTMHTRFYKGHCNIETTKDVNFFGLRDEYVMSGSDCGNFFIWDKMTGQNVNVLAGDGEVVNVLQRKDWGFPYLEFPIWDTKERHPLTNSAAHPHEPIIAVSGIDSTIKIFSPDARSRRDAGLANGVEEADQTTFSSILGHSRDRGGNGDDTANNREAADGEYEGYERSPRGLHSRQRLHEAYEIESTNEMRNQRGLEGSFISTSVVQVHPQLNDPQAATSADIEMTDYAPADSSESSGSWH